MTYCNWWARYSMKRDDIESLRAEVNTYIDNLFNELKLYQEPPKQEYKKNNNMIRYLWDSYTENRWANNKKSDRLMIEKQILQWEKYTKIGTDNNITHQRVQQIAKSIWIKRHKKMKTNIENLNG